MNSLYKIKYSVLIYSSLHYVISNEYCFFEKLWRILIQIFDEIQKWKINTKQFVWLVYYIPSVFELQWMNHSFFFLESADPVHESDGFIHSLDNPKQLYT